MPPVGRICQAMARCATPPSTSSQATTIVTPIPATGGMTIARMPARIRTILSAMAQPADSFAIPMGDESTIFFSFIGVVLLVRLSGAPAEHSPAESGGIGHTEEKTLYRIG